MNLLKIQNSFIIAKNSLILIKISVNLKLEITTPPEFVTKVWGTKVGKCKLSYNLFIKI